MAKLEHSNLPKVFDYFEENDKYYLAMTLIQGENLADKMGSDSDQPLPERQVLEWMNQVLDALEYCHENKVIHRDVKPANIIVTPDRKVFLVDFGIARPDNPGRALSRSIQIISEGYSPLEQYSSGSADVRSDVYSTGATMYHLLTGKAPLDARRRGAGQEELPSPRAIMRTVSPAVNMAIMKAMELRVDRRFQTIEEFRRALRRKQWERKRVVPWLCLVLALLLGASLAFRWNKPAAGAFIQAFVTGPVHSTATTEVPAIPPAFRTVEPTWVILGPVPVQTTEARPAQIAAVTSLPAPTFTRRTTAVPGAVAGLTPSRTAVSQARTTTATPISPTATRVPPTRTSTIRPTATSLPVQPSASPTRPKTISPATRSTAPSVAGVTLVGPAAGEMLQGVVTFQWQPSPGFSLGPGEQGELVFWKPGQEPMLDGRSPVGASDRTSFVIDLASLEVPIGLVPGPNFWGVRLWGGNRAIRMLSESRPFTYERPSGGGPPSTWTPPPP